MKIKLTRQVLPEAGLTRGRVMEVVENDGGKLAVKSDSGFSIFLHADEYVEVKDDS